MDNLFDKFGIYDFFGLLIPGMLFFITLLYIDFPLIKDNIYPSSSTFELIIFILVSYILGVLIQEIGSFLDRKFTKIRIKSRENFLKPDKTFFSDYEFEEVKKIANKLLKKKDKNNEFFTNKECVKIFFECKACLENSGKMSKANKLDASFAMSRSFVVCNICIFVSLIIRFFYTILEKQFSWSLSYILILVYLFLSSVIFYNRAKRYSQMRTKTIIRQYIDLYKK